MPDRVNASRYLICVRNDGYAASLDLRKVYQTIPDEVATSRRFVLVIDESGEDYLYPADFFVPIELPKAAERVSAQVS